MDIYCAHHLCWNFREKGSSYCRTHITLDQLTDDSPAMKLLALLLPITNKWRTFQTPRIVPGSRPDADDRVIPSYQTIDLCEVGRRLEVSYLEYKHNLGLIDPKLFWPPADMAIRLKGQQTDTTFRDIVLSWRYGVEEHVYSRDDKKYVAPSIPSNATPQVASAGNLGDPTRPAGSLRIYPLTGNHTVGDQVPQWGLIHGHVELGIFGRPPRSGVAFSSKDSIFEIVAARPHSFSQNPNEITLLAKLEGKDTFELNELSRDVAFFLSTICGARRPILCLADKDWEPVVITPGLAAHPEHRYQLSDDPEELKEWFQAIHPHMKKGQVKNILGLWIELERRLPARVERYCAEAFEFLEYLLVFYGLRPKVCGGVWEQMACPSP